jgi:hypothetical protein
LSCKSLALTDWNRPVWVASKDERAVVQVDTIIAQKRARRANVYG